MSLKEENKFLKEKVGELKELELLDHSWIEYAKSCISTIESQNKQSDSEYRADKAGYG